MLGNQRHMSTSGSKGNQTLLVEVFGHLPIIVRPLMNSGVITAPHLHSHPLLLLEPTLSMGILKEEEELHHLSQNRLCLGTLAEKGKGMCFWIMCMGLAISTDRSND